MYTLKDIEKKINEEFPEVRTSMVSHIQALPYHNLNITTGGINLIIDWISSTNQFSMLLYTKSDVYGKSVTLSPNPGTSSGYSSIRNLAHKRAKLTADPQVVYEKIKNILSEAQLESKPLFDYKSDRNWTTEELSAIASKCVITPEILNHVEFDPDGHYVRKSLYKTEHLEIVLICFDKMQGSTVHDHKGSNCTIKVVDGVILESTFRTEINKITNVETLYIHRTETLKKDDISSLDGKVVHQVTNAVDKSILLNFYSPPFEV